MGELSFDDWVVVQRVRRNLFPFDGDRFAGLRATLGRLDYMPSGNSTHESWAAYRFVRELWLALHCNPPDFRQDAGLWYVWNACCLGLHRLLDLCKSEFLMRVIRGVKEKQ